MERVETKAKSPESPAYTSRSPRDVSVSDKILLNEQQLKNEPDFGRPIFYRKRGSSFRKYKYMKVLGDFTGFGAPATSTL